MIKKELNKVLFADVDGVLNSEKTVRSHRGLTGIDPYKAFLVGRILLNTGAEMVLSSTWRLGEETREEVRKQVGEFIDVTPQFIAEVGSTYGSGHRGMEIGMWLALHPEVERYAILDDDDDMLPDQMPHFFKTTWQEGLTDEIAMTVEFYLNSKAIIQS